MCVCIQGNTETRSLSVNGEFCFCFLNFIVPFVATGPSVCSVQLFTARLTMRPLTQSASKFKQTRTFVHNFKKSVKKSTNEFHYYEERLVTRRERVKCEVRRKIPAGLSPRLRWGFADSDCQSPVRGDDSHTHIPAILWKVISATVAPTRRFTSQALSQVHSTTGVEEVTRLCLNCVHGFSDTETRGTLTISESTRLQRFMYSSTLCLTAGFHL